MCVCGVCFSVQVRAVLTLLWIRSSGGKFILFSTLIRYLEIGRIRHRSVGQRSNRSSVLVASDMKFERHQKDCRLYGECLRTCLYVFSWIPGALVQNNMNVATLWIPSREWKRIQSSNYSSPNVWQCRHLTMHAKQIWKVQTYVLYSYRFRELNETDRRWWIMSHVGYI